MAERALPDLVSRVVVDTSPLNAATAGVSAALGGMVSRVKDSASEMDGHFKAISLGMIGVGATMTATAGVVIGESIKMASEFDNATRQLAGSAQIPVQSAQAIGQSFLTSGEQTTFSAQEMVSALAPVARQLEDLSGHALTTAEAQKFMSASAELAEASHVGLSDATKVLAGVMQAYGIPLNQAEQATNTLYNTSRLVNLPLDDLQNLLGRLHARLGPIAPSLNDTSTLMVDLAKNGITGSRAMNQVNTSMTTLLSGTPAVNAELTKLGIKIFDSQGHFVGLRSVIEQTSNAEKGMTDQQKLATDAIIFGGGSAKGMFDVIKGGTGTWDAAAAAAGQAGAAHKAAGDAMGGVEGQQKILAAQMKNLGVVIGQDFLPFVTALLGAITPIITAIVHWAAAHPQLATGILLGATALGVLLVVVGGFLIIVPALVAGIGAVTAVSLPWLLIILAVIAAVALLAAGVVLLITHWSQVTGFITGTVVPALLGVWHWIQQLYFAHQTLFTILLLFVSPLILVALHWQQIWAILQAFAGWIVGFFIGMWSGLVEAVIGAWSAIYGAISGFLGAIYGAIASTFGAIYGAVAGAVGAVWGFITAAFGAISLFLRTWGVEILAILVLPFWLAWQAIAPILSGLWTFIGGVFGGIFNTISGWLNAIWTWVSNVFAGIFGTISGWLNSIWTWVSNVWSGIFGTISGWLNAIWTWVGNIFSGIFNTISGWLNAIWTWVTNVWSGIFNTISGWLNAIWTWVNNIWSVIFSTISNWLNAIWTWVSNIWTAIFNTISSWLNSIWTQVGNIWAAVFNTISSWLNAIWTWVGNIFSAVYNTATSWTQQLFDRVSQIWNGLATMVTKALSDMSNAAKGQLNWIIDNVINAFADAVNKSPLGKIGVKIDPMPHFAEGGIVERPTVGLIGEAGSEAVIPLTPGRRSLDLWEQAGRAIGAFTQHANMKPPPPRRQVNELVGLGAGPSLSGLPTSGHGGQCLAFLSQYFPQLRGIPAAKDAASLINTTTPKAGEVAIATFAPFGHAALVIEPPNMILDSNWGEDEMIRIHPLADMHAAGFIDFGATLGTLAGGAAGGAPIDVGAIINGLLSDLEGKVAPFLAEGAPGHWLAGLPHGLLTANAGKIVDWIKTTFASQLASAAAAFTGSLSGFVSGAVNAADITRLALQAGWPANEIPKLLIIIQRESGGNPNAVGPRFNGDAGSIGLMQIQTGAHPEYDVNKLKDPLFNLEAGLQIWRQAGWGAWSTNFDNGGILAQGLNLLENRTGGPEPLSPTNPLSEGQNEMIGLLQSIEKKVVGHLEVNTYGTNLTPRDVAREIVQEVRAI